MSYDSARGVTIIYGGLVGTNLNGVDFPASGISWEWDGTSWTQITPMGGVFPPARAFAKMVYDSARKVHLLYGGQDTNGDNLTDTWEYTGSTHSWMMRSQGGPPAMFGESLAYDPARNQTVLFGGETVNGTFLNDTWTWNGQTGTWSLSAPFHKPPARREQVMAFDTIRGVLVMQGGLVITLDYGNGNHATGFTSSTWEWNGTDWTDKSSSYNFCCGIPLNAMAYESTRQQMIIYDAAGTTLDNLMMTTWALATGSGQPITYADVANHGAVDGSQAHPYSTVQQAATCAIGGSSVSIQSGDYAEGYSVYTKQITFTTVGGQVRLH